LSINENKEHAVKKLPLACACALSLGGLADTKVGQVV